MRRLTSRPHSRPATSFLRHAPGVDLALAELARFQEVGTRTSSRRENGRVQPETRFSPRDRSAAQHLRRYATGWRRPGESHGNVPSSSPCAQRLPTEADIVAMAGGGPRAKARGSRERVACCDEHFFVHPRRNLKLPGARRAPHPEATCYAKSSTLPEGHESQLGRDKPAAPSYQPPHRTLCSCTDELLIHLAPRCLESNGNKALLSMPGGCRSAPAWPGPGPSPTHTTTAV